MRLCGTDPFTANLWNSLHSTDVELTIFVEAERDSSGGKPYILKMGAYGRVFDLYDFQASGESDYTGLACRLQVCYSPVNGRTKGMIFWEHIDLTVDPFDTVGLFGRPRIDDFDSLRSRWRSAIFPSSQTD